MPDLELESGPLAGFAGNREFGGHCAFPKHCQVREDQSIIVLLNGQYYGRASQQNRQDQSCVVERRQYPFTVKRIYGPPISIIHG
jgi:hypothetical protein